MKMFITFCIVGLMFSIWPPEPVTATVPPVIDLEDSVARLRRYADSQYLCNREKLIELELLILQLKTSQIDHNKTLSK